MNAWWMILGIEKTTDIKAIKQAYAKALKRYHPEEEPLKFQEVQAAYKEGIRFAKANKKKQGEDVDLSHHVAQGLHRSSSFENAGDGDEKTSEDGPSKQTIEDESVEQAFGNDSRTEREQQSFEASSRNDGALNLEREPLDPRDFGGLPPEKDGKSGNSFFHEDGIQSQRSVTWESAQTREELMHWLQGLISQMDGELSFTFVEDLPKMTRLQKKLRQFDLLQDFDLMLISLQMTSMRFTNTTHQLVYAIRAYGLPYLANKLAPFAERRDAGREDLSQSGTSNQEFSAGDRIDGSLSLEDFLDRKESQSSYHHEDLGREREISFDRTVGFGQEQESPYQEWTLGENEEEQRVGDFFRTNFSSVFASKTGWKVAKSKEELRQWMQWYLASMQGSLSFNDIKDLPQMEQLQQKLIAFDLMKEFDLMLISLDIRDIRFQRWAGRLIPELKAYGLAYLSGKLAPLLAKQKEWEKERDLEVAEKRKTKIKQEFVWAVSIALGIIFIPLLTTIPFKNSRTQVKQPDYSVQANIQREMSKYQESSEKEAMSKFELKEVQRMIGVLVKHGKMELKIGEDGTTSLFVDGVLSVGNITDISPLSVGSILYTDGKVYYRDDSSLTRIRDPYVYPAYEEGSDSLNYIVTTSDFKSWNVYKVGDKDILWKSITRIDTDLQPITNAKQSGLVLNVSRNELKNP